MTSTWKSKRFEGKLHLEDIHLQLLKFIKNTSTLDKGNHDSDGVWISDLNWHRFFSDFTAPFSPLF